MIELKEMDSIQIQISEYLSTLGVLYSGTYKHNSTLPKKAVKMGCIKAVPSVAIHEAKRGFHGLFLFVLPEETKLYRKRGGLIEDVNIHAQSVFLQKLRNRGYAARFAIGYKESKEIIDWYLEYKEFIDNPKGKSFS